MLIPLQSELSFCYFSEHVSDLKLGLWLEQSHVQVTEQFLSGPCLCGVNAATGSAEQVMLQESQAANPRPSFGKQHCACLWIRSPDNLLHIWMLLSYTALFLFQFLKAIYLVNTLLFHLPIIFSCQKDQRCNGWEWAGCKPVCFAPVYLTWICHCHGCAGFILSCCIQRERESNHWLVMVTTTWRKKGIPVLGGCDGGREMTSEL